MNAMSERASASVAEPGPASGRVCAVVVTRNRRDLLRRCLDGLLDQVRPADAILVVDNASVDGTDRLLDLDYPHAVRLARPANGGAAAGFGDGMAWAMARPFEWLWLMDDDVVPDRDGLKELLETAALSGRAVAVPRRLSPDGGDCASEAVLVESAQRLDVVRTDPERERHRPIDLFTFEGPLIHRSVVAALGPPDPGLFIRGEDILYAAAISRRFGPLAAVLATRAVMRRQLPAPPAIRGTLRLKGWIAPDATYQVLEDEHHWKLLYELRNRHVLWRRLGWTRRRRQLAVLHLGYVAVDLAHALRRRWDWRLRLRWNVVSLVQGLRGSTGAFLDPAPYLERVAARRRRRTGGPG